MALLLNTNIEELVGKKINGKIARVGGAVGQLIKYKNCKVKEINVFDGGFGVVNKYKFSFNPIYYLRILKHYLYQEIQYKKKGSSVIRDRKTILVDAHDLIYKKNIKDKFNNIISSNMIEHSPNPIYLLLNFYFITKKDGYQFHAIPHYKYTYDSFRTPTTIEHLLEDFKENTPFSDTTHNDDYIESAIVKDGWQKEFHHKYPVSYPFIHFHVFDENNICELFNLMFEDVTNDIIKTAEFSDNVVFFKNRLKSSFVEKYRDIINDYSKHILE